MYTLGRRCLHDHGEVMEWKEFRAWEAVQEGKGCREPGGEGVS